MGSKAPDQSKKKAADSQQVLPALTRHSATVNLVLVRRAAFRGLEASGHRITIAEVLCKGHHGQNRSPRRKKGRELGEESRGWLLLFPFSPQAQVHLRTWATGSSYIPAILKST